MKDTLWYSGFDEKQLEQIKWRFEKLLGKKIDFEYVEDKSLVGGFTAHIDGIAYDMSFKKRLDTMRMSLSREKDLQNVENNIQSILSNRVQNLGFSSDVYEYGNIVSAGDGVIQVKGLGSVKYGEMLTIAGGAEAIALEISEESVGAAVLQGEVCIGGQVNRTGRVLDVPVGEGVLGRVLSPIGEPIDGGPVIKFSARRPIENPAPKIFERKTVGRPLQTGILSLDSMTPIGRGQRELIIGDRQTGKTTIAIDTILNQKDQEVLCVYCAVGQKASTVAEVVQTLEEKGAMQYTVVVSSPASDLPAMQYIAPYSACAIAEHFMHQGRDVLIIFDDLSKHAVAYRTMSLLLHRPPGREAYPGDVFYLHSRLLERSAQLSDENGGGSITAIPIVETMAGDISAYIPTNIISITDGQIFLESELFHAGMRPAINVGLSVSRVGRSAQSAAMRKVTGTLRLDLAQFREMSIFLQFGGEVDSSTKQMLENGARKNELLKQPKHRPYSLAEEVCLLLAAENSIFSEIEIDEVGTFFTEMLAELNKLHLDKLQQINKKKDFDDDLKKDILTSMKRIAGEYKERSMQKS